MSTVPATKDSMPVELFFMILYSMPSSHGRSFFQ